MSELDPLIHPPKRLRIMSLLAATDGIEFAFLRQRLDLSPSDLSKQMSTLEDAGYVKVHKTGRGPGSTTWYRLTRLGRGRYEAHVGALRDLIAPLSGQGG